MELLNYRASIEEQITYDRKKDYFLLINKYLSQFITPSEFRLQYLKMEEEDSKKATIILQDYQQLKVFSLLENLDEFSNLMSSGIGLLIECQKMNSII